MLQNDYNYVEKKMMIIWSAFYISKLEKYYNNITCLSSSHRKVKGTSFFLALNQTVSGIFQINLCRL